MLRQKAPKATKKTTKKQSPTSQTKKQTPLKQQKRSKHKSMTFTQAFTGVPNTKFIPMSEIFPHSVIGIPVIPPTPFTPVTKMSKLRNGMTVITQSSNLPVSHMSLSVDMGSRYENHANGEQGLSHFLERSILRSTENRVTSTLVRDLSKLGAEISSSASREHFTISATTPSRINPVLGAIADITKHAVYEREDFNIDFGFYSAEQEHRQITQIPALVNDLLHQAAFGNKGLGQVQQMSAAGLHDLTPKHLQAWHKNFMVSDRMTLGAVGVDHDTFVALADEMFGSMNQKVVDIQDEPTEYVGGNARVHDIEYMGPSHIALAWKGPSLKCSNVVAAHVLQAVLNGGAAFSSTPSRGVHSRLNRNISSQHQWVENVDSFLTTYTDSGLMGFYATVDPAAAGDYVDEILNEVTSLPKSLTDDEVNRAKNSLKQSLHHHITSGANRAEELARNVQVFGDYKIPQFLQQIDAITTNDVKKVAEQIFLNKEDAITVASYGDVTSMPRDVTL